MFFDAGLRVAGFVPQLGSWDTKPTRFWHGQKVPTRLASHTALSAVGIRAQRETFAILKCTCSQPPHLSTKYERQATRHMSYDHTVKVRICASTHKAIKAQAARLGLSVSEYLRLVYALDISLNADAALEGRIECICLNTSLLQHFFYLYARAGNNLNQATRALNILAKTTLKISRGSQLKYVADCLKSVSSDLDKTSLLLGDIALRPSVYLP